MHHIMCARRRRPDARSEPILPSTYYLVGEANRGNESFYSSITTTFTKRSTELRWPALPLFGCCQKASERKSIHRCSGKMCRLEIGWLSLEGLPFRSMHIKIQYTNLILMGEGHADTALMLDAGARKHFFFGLRFVQ